jgi:hypothetical protein
MDQVSEPIDILVVLLVVACGAPGLSNVPLLGTRRFSSVNHLNTHSPRQALPCFHEKDVKE